MTSNQHAKKGGTLLMGMIYPDMEGETRWALCNKVKRSMRRAQGSLRTAFSTAFRTARCSAQSLHLVIKVRRKLQQLNKGNT
jgi:hypothetical protein